MMFSGKYSTQPMPVQESNENFLQGLMYYLRKGHWFVLSVLLCLFLADIRYQYQTPYYQATARVLFKTDENGSMFSENSAFQDLGSAYYTYSPIENEIEILKSRSIMKQVVKDLKLNIVFYNNNGLVEVEEYDPAPMNITFLEGDSSIYNQGARYEIDIQSKNTFIIANEHDNFKVSGEFGKPFKCKLGEIILTPNSKYGEMKAGMEFILYVYELENSVDQYVGQVQVERTNEMSNVLEVSLIDNSIQKAKDVVNKLIFYHQQEAIADKNQVARNSAAFINDRIQIIAKELSDVEGSQLTFKSANNIVDVNSEATLFAETQQDLEQQIIENQIQLKMAEYVSDYIGEDIKPTELIPTNLGLSDQSIAHAIETYNSLVLERNRILKNSNEKNPVALNLESKIINLQGNLRGSLDKYLHTLRLRNNQLMLQNKKLNNRISAVPLKEKALREIERQQQIKESLYLYLLQKREETAITLSLTVANSRVIDEAHSNGNVVSPNKKNYYLMGLIFGFMIPFVLFFVRRKLNNKITSSKEIERQGLRIIGEIPRIKTRETNFVFTQGEQSAFAEAMRLLRTNIEFELSSLPDQCRVVMLTSSLSQEGKSFIAMNIAQSVSLTDKKVLVVGMDLRSPTLHKFLGIPLQKGVSNFIADPAQKIEDLIIHQPNDFKFDVLLSGDIPPNPSELLTHPRIGVLFEYLQKNYEYIILDTPPVASVSDTLLLTPFVDLSLYVIREGFTERKYLREIQHIRKDEKLKQLRVVMNYSAEKANYGYYHQEKASKRWWPFNK